MRFSNKQNITNTPFSREGTTYYAAALSVIVAQMATNGAWANATKRIDLVEFAAKTTSLDPQNPTTITHDAISQPPKFIINALSKDLIQELEEKFSENSRLDFKPIQTDETVIDHLSMHDEDVQQDTSAENKIPISDDPIHEEISHMLQDDDEADLLMAQINAYNEEVIAIAVADEADAKANPKVNIEDESSSAGLILTIVGLLGAAGAGLAFAGGRSDSKPAPSPPPTFTIGDEKINEGSTKLIAMPETDQYGPLKYEATYDSDEFDLTFADNVLTAETYDDEQAKVIVTASNIYDLSTTAGFTLTVKNLNPKMVEIKNQEIASGGELTINLSAKDVKSDSIKFTAATSDENLINLSIIDFDITDHNAKLKITPHDSLPPGVSVTDVRVTATDDDGGSNSDIFKVTINTLIPPNPDIPTVSQAIDTKADDTIAAESTETTEAKVAESTETTEAKVAESTETTEAMVAESTETTEAMVAESTETTEAMVAESTETTEAMVAESTETTEAMVAESTETTEAMVAESTETTEAMVAESTETTEAMVAESTETTEAMVAETTSPAEKTTGNTSTTGAKAAETTGTTEANDSDEFDLTFADNVLTAETYDDEQAKVIVTASNIYDLSTTAGFTLTVKNLNPKMVEIKNQEIASGGELTINLSAKDVKSDSIKFTAATSDENLINLSIIDFDITDHNAKLKITPHDSLPPGVSVTDVRVTATDDDGGSNSDIFKVTINTLIPPNPDIPTVSQAIDTKADDTIAAESTETTEAKVAESTETTEAMVAESTETTEAMVAESTETTEAMVAESTETTEAMVAESTETTEAMVAESTETTEAMVAESTETTEAMVAESTETTEAMVAESTETTEAMVAESTETTEAMVAESTETTEAMVAETTSPAEKTTGNTSTTGAKAAETTNKAAETTEAKTTEASDSKDSTTTVVTTKSSPELDDIVVTESDLQEESGKTQTASRQDSASSDSKSGSIEKQTTTDIDSDEADLL